MPNFENFTTEMVAVCILISIVAAFAYVYRKRVKNEYAGAKLGKDSLANKEKPKKKINPQGTKNDFMILLSGLVSLGRKKKWPLIAPAVMHDKADYTQLAGLIVTPTKIIGVCAFGHGGTIVAGSAQQDWTQRANGEEKKIASPLKAMKKAEHILNQKVKDLGITNRTVEIFGTYTHPHAELHGAAADLCYTTETLLKYLGNESGEEELSPENTALIEKLRTVVIKPETSKKKKKKK